MGFWRKKKLGLKEVTALYEQAKEQFGPDIDGKSQEWAKFMLNGVAAILGLPVTYEGEGEKLVVELGDRKMEAEAATTALTEELVAQIVALQKQMAEEKAKGVATAVTLGRKKHYVEAVLNYFA